MCRKRVTGIGGVDSPGSLRCREAVSANANWLLAGRRRDLTNVRAVLFVLRVHLEDVVVGEKVVRDADRERPRVHFRIVERHLDVEVTEVAAAKAFDNAKLVA